MPLRRDVGYYANGDAATDGIKNLNINDAPQEELDVVVIGAGFSGCKLLHDLRKKGFKVKVVEAGSDLGGIWYWNQYPGARVDSQYPVYALSIPEVYETWEWEEQYPGVDELQRYFAHVEKTLNLKKDMYLNTRCKAATFDATTDKWTITSTRADGTALTLTARFFVPCIGFAAKRHIPDWPGIDSFKGEIYHSSFWPKHVPVEGKHVAVIGNGATGVQIAQETAHDIGPNGSLKVFIRTPNIALAMRQAKIPKGQAQADKQNVKEVLTKTRFETAGGFHWHGLDKPLSEHSPEERERIFEEAWQQGGFRLLTAFNDILLDPECNQQTYDFWARKVRERIDDPKTKDILAPLEAPHPFGAKRPSLEQDYYEQFNKPNIHAISVPDETNPIVAIEPTGIRTKDGILHEVDIIALATGFDSVNGGMKDIDITGLNGHTLQDHWADGTYTYLGLSVADVPNFFFTYGAQAPTAFSNGPSCLEPQCDWIERVLEDQREKGWTRINATREKEQEWKQQCEDFSAMTLRHNVKSWYMGTNIPGKKKEALNYSGGLPLYIETITEVADKDWAGFEVSGGTADKKSSATSNGVSHDAKSTAQHVEHIEDLDVHKVPAAALGTSR